MSRPYPLALLALSLVAAPVLRAQEQAQPLIVKTFTLRHLNPASANRLVEPYILSSKGGVFEVGGAIRAITVRETAQNVARIDSLLRAHDRSPTTLTFRFQLIAAEDQPTRDPAIGGLDSTLRGLLRFAGYRLLSQAVVTVGEAQTFAQTLNANDERLLLAGEVSEIHATDGNGSVYIQVRLGRARGVSAAGKEMPDERLLQTGVSVPLGQTVVLGSAVPGGKVRALILAVRPEVASAREP
jgi:hypothetical protein